MEVNGEHGTAAVRRLPVFIGEREKARDWLVDSDNREVGH